MPVAPEKLKFPEKACAKELLIEVASRSNAAEANRDRVPERRKTALMDWGRGAAEDGYRMAEGEWRASVDCNALLCSGAL